MYVLIDNEFTTEAIELRKGQFGFETCSRPKLIIGKWSVSNIFKAFVLKFSNTVVLLIEKHFREMESQSYIDFI